MSPKVIIASRQYLESILPHSPSSKGLIVRAPTLTRTNRERFFCNLHAQPQSSHNVTLVDGGLPCHL